MIQPIKSNFQPAFKANLSSPKLRLASDDFFIKIKGYGQNQNWAEEIIKTTDDAVNLIRENRGFNQVLRAIVEGVRGANSLTEDESKRTKTGILRAPKSSWSYEGKEVYTYYKDNRYSCYRKRLDEVARKPLKRIGSNLALSYPNTRDIVHGESFFINNSLEHVLKLFNSTIPKFINGELKKESLGEVNNAIAEIRWVLAHATPWLRGSDAISNVLMRAMYKAIGVKTYPSKENLSFDLEAYCTELEDYKKEFPNYFIKPPEVIE